MVLCTYSQLLAPTLHRHTHRHTHQVTMGSTMLRLNHSLRCNVPAPFLSCKARRDPRWLGRLALIGCWLRAVDQQAWVFPLFYLYIHLFIYLSILFLVYFSSTSTYFELYNSLLAIFKSLLVKSKK